MPITDATPAHDQGSTRAVVIDRFGGPLRIDDVPSAPPTGRQVRIRVAAAAVNPVDRSTAAGLNIPLSAARFPMVLGWDAAGVVESVGSGVSDWRVGDRVAAMTFQPLDQNGTYRQLLTLDADLLARVRAGLSLEVAASVPLAGVTADQLVQRVELADGASLLVNAPLGSVGRFVVQLAARAGLRVVAVTRPEQRGAAHALGATDVVDRGDFGRAARALHPAGVDAAIDLVGGAAARAALDAVKDGGTYRTALPSYNEPNGVLPPERDVRVDVHTVEPDAPRLAELLQLVHSGAITAPIQQTFPLSEAGEAHRLQAAGGLTGKLLLVP